MVAFDYHKQAQNYYSQSPTIILGSGASAAFGMSGMWDLAQHLKKSVDVNLFEGDDNCKWDEFVTLLDADTDLETALHKVDMSVALTNQIVTKTWELINNEDIGVFEASLADRNHFPLGRLLNHYFQSTATAINIVTTNYDRLAEFACEQEGLHHYSGFSHGFRRLLKEQAYIRCARTVNIWKVHGSLDWFKSDAGEVIGFGNLANIPNALTPQIVTPGTEKYRITHLEPFRTIIAHADNAIEEANSYLAVGFGFNDQHIQEKLIQKCVREKAAIVVITYKLSDETKKFLFEKGVENFLAIERGNSDEESVIYSSLCDEPITVSSNHWSLEGFLELII